MKSEEELFAIAHSGVLLLDLPEYHLFRVSGRDTVRYLHGRCTQDVKGLRPGSGAMALVLTPQGRIQARFAMLKEESDFLLVSDPGPGESAREEFVRALLQFRVADDVQVEDLSPGFRLVSLQGPGSGSVVAALFGIDASSLAQKLSFAHATFGAGETVTVISRPRGTESGYDVIIGSALKNELENAVRSLEPAVEVARLSSDVSEMLRITSGEPVWGRDLGEKVLAPEIPLEELVAYDKGCYAGQELVEKATARGRPNRKLVALSGAGIVQAGNEITAAEESKPCGTVTSACYFPSQDRSFCLAFVKSAIEAPAELRSGGSVLSWS